MQLITIVYLSSSLALAQFVAGGLCDTCVIHADELQNPNNSYCFRKMHHITQIAIAGKNITVPKAFVEQTKHVFSLEINFNGLSSIDGTSICEWSNLEFLQADSNNLEKLSSGILSNCRQLKILNLRNNKINEIASDAFVGLSSLEDLDLSSNQITFLDKNVFEPLKELDTLDLRENQIQIDSSQLFQYNSKLSSLSLYSNDLRYLLDYLII